ncbi:amidase [Coralliovum pocilloporae]|uniref:amidase n=1 Tax=Coralliovum pocilloporae TaxID=3066369 RepID=UPI0033079CCE
MTDLAFTPATDLIDMLDRRELSPVELMEAIIARIDADNDQINAFITLDLDQAMDEARASERRRMQNNAKGILDGIPYAVKDSFDTKDLRSTSGSLIHEDRVPDRDHLHVKRMRDAGAIVFGKTNIPEFCYGGQSANAVAGITRNPYDLSRTVGGSSGGAGAAIAAGMASLADGSDLGGSVRVPAGWCNMVGYRPSVGGMPTYPKASPFDGLSVWGPMTRTIADTALMVDVTTGWDKRSPLKTTSRHGSCLKRLNRPISGLRIAWSSRPLGAQTHPDVETVLDTARQVLVDLGCDVTDACPDIQEIFIAQHVARSLKAFSELGPLVGENETIVSKAVRNSIDDGRRLSVQQIAHARRIQAQCWETLIAFFDDYDILAWPTNPGLAFSADTPVHDVEADWTSVTATPILGLPALSVPAGFSPDGLPVGLQLLAPVYEDLELLQLAHAFEEATGWWKTRPTGRGD